MEPKNAQTRDLLWLEQARPVGDSAAISLGRHCFVSIVARMANSPISADRMVAENEHLQHEVESLREELRLKDARMGQVAIPASPSLLPWPATASVKKDD